MNVTFIHGEDEKISLERLIVLLKLQADLMNMDVHFTFSSRQPKELIEEKENTEGYDRNFNPGGRID